jgi:hypothetical protein
MAMQYDVKAAHIEDTGTLVAERTRLKGYQCISGGTAGDVIFRDGGSGGTIRLRFNIGTGTQPVGLSIPGEGILFNTSIHVTVPGTAPNAAKVTVFYG